jgi:hypothetical protein
LLVVDVQVVHRSANLASPSVSFQNPFTKKPVLFAIEPQSRSLLP